MSLRNPPPNKFQIADESAIQEDLEKFKAPKVGDTVNVVAPDGAEFSGTVRAVLVTQVREKGRVIDGQFQPDKNKSDMVFLKDCTYCSEERLALKWRPKTWHWPAEEAAKK